MTKSFSSFRDAETHVPPKKLPEIYVCGSVKLGYALFADRVFEMRDLRTKFVGDPRPMAGPAILHHLVKQREFVFLFQALDVQIAILFILLDQTGNSSFHIPGWSRRPISLEFLAQYQERSLEQTISRTEAPQESSHRDAGFAGDVFEGDLIQSA